MVRRGVDLRDPSCLGTDVLETVRCRYRRIQDEQRLEAPRNRDQVAVPDTLVFGANTKIMAERVGFEPTVEFPPHTLSKRAP
jgi:hypothetical protein